MTVSSPSKLRLPHASAGPLWCPLPAVETHGWQEIETLLSAPTLDLAPNPPKRRGIGSFALVAAALVMGCGVLATTLISGRGDCGDACHVVTASTGPTGEPAAAAPPGTDVASRSDSLAEGRSVADGADAAKPDTPGAEASALPPRRHHHHRRHSYVEP